MPSRRGQGNFTLVWFFICTHFLKPDSHWGTFYDALRNARPIWLRMKPENHLKWRSAFSVSPKNLNFCKIILWFCCRSDLFSCFVVALYYRGADKSLARPGRKQVTFPAFYGTWRFITTFTRYVYFIIQFRQHNIKVKATATCFDLTSHLQAYLRTETNYKMPVHIWDPRWLTMCVGIRL